MPQIPFLNYINTIIYFLYLTPYFFFLHFLQVLIKNFDENKCRKTNKNLHLFYTKTSTNVIEDR